MVRVSILGLAFLGCVFPGFGLQVTIGQVLDAPQSPFGHVFSYGDWLEYLSNGTLIYMGVVPANVYALNGGRFDRLVDRFTDSIYEVRKPDAIASELLPSRVESELLYCVRTRGAQQESFRILPTGDRGASIDKVDRQYWELNQDRELERDLSLLQGCRLELKTPSEMEGAGIVEPQIVNNDGSLAFSFTKLFPELMVNHFGQVAISPDKTKIAMIVNYVPNATGRNQSRLVVLDINYDL